MYTSGNRYTTDIVVTEKPERVAARACRASLDRDLKISVIYLGIAVFLAFFGAVYEYFSHGVYSYYMIYAFAIPLVGGTLPYLISYIRKLKAGTQKVAFGTDVSAALGHAAVATLTIGSIIKGVLDIYGTTNHLIVVYPATGVMLIIASIAVAAAAGKRHTD